MGKNVTVTQINMCEKMVKDDFQPIISRLEFDGNIHSQKIREELQKKYGLIELHAQQEALKLKLKQVTDEIDSYEKERWVRDYSTPTYSGTNISRLNEEVNSLTRERNRPLQEILAAKKGILREVQLASLPGDLKVAVEKAAEVIASLLKELPAPEVVEATKEIGE